MRFALITYPCQQTPVRYAEDDAGYVTVRPVVKQTFRLHELVDLVVSVVGKDAARIQQIFRTRPSLQMAITTGGIAYSADLPEIEALVATFPDDDLLRAPFEPATITAVLFESGGGAQRNLVEITPAEAADKKLFAKT